MGSEGIGLVVAGVGKDRGHPALRRLEAIEPRLIRRPIRCLAKRGRDTAASFTAELFGITA